MYQAPRAQVHDAAAVLTPERVALTLPYAGLGSRFVALAIDTVIQATALFAVALLLIPASLVGGFASGSTRFGISLGLAAGVVIAFVVLWGYFVLFEALWNGQTPGKRAARIRVVRHDGRPIGWTAATVRNLVRIVDVLPAAYLVGIVAVFVSRESRRVGDYAAGTIVIRDEPVAAPEALRPEALRPGAVDPLRASRLRPEEYDLVRAFLLRRAALAPEARQALARKIAGPISAHLDLPVGGSEEAFLEGLARAYRATEGAAGGQDSV